MHLSRACQLHAGGLLMDRNFNGLPQCSQDEAIKKAHLDSEVLPDNWRACLVVPSVLRLGN